MPIPPLRHDRKVTVPRATVGRRSGDGSNGKLPSGCGPVDNGAEGFEAATTLTVAEFGISLFRASRAEPPQWAAIRLHCHSREFEDLVVRVAADSFKRSEREDFIDHEQALPSRIEVRRVPESS